ncbi:DUF4390 domain-containing protein [Paracidovorax anthurii]|uniref:Uncharacterized protein DUF4390 n=2 Tax=Paracidovorax anthurii TaxID=78229 RepID=A0A328YWP5_9BURK|nr:uncharacterized protein DUF4390 [Paracidovorax anthurii]
MTDSFTHFWASVLDDLRAGRGGRRRGRAPLSGRVGWLHAFAVCVALWLGAAMPATAQTGGDVPELRLDASDSGLYLSAVTRFELPDLAEDALFKGISVYFIAEADVLRERWYWSDKTVASAVRYLRLSYQPLTRRWRLNQSSVPFAHSGLGVVLGQSYDELGDAMAAMQRISRWKIADADEIDRQAAHVVHFRFRLDMSQLPRPFQIGAMGRNGWDLTLSRTERLSAEP